MSDIARQMLVPSAIGAKPGLATHLVVRQARHTDTEAVRRFLQGLSSESRLRRFFNTVPHIGPTMVQTLTSNSPHQATLLAIQDDVVVGHAMMVCVGDRVAEVGIVVSDAHQLRGIGTWLLNELAETAARLGVGELRFDVLSNNHFLLGWLRRALPGIRWTHGGVTKTGRWAADSSAPKRR